MRNSHLEYNQRYYEKFLLRTIQASYISLGIKMKHKYEVFCLFLLLLWKSIGQKVVNGHWLLVNILNYSEKKPIQKDLYVCFQLDPRESITYSLHIGSILIV